MNVKDYAVITILGIYKEGPPKELLPCKQLLSL